MPTDLVFFFKALPPKEAAKLPWPGPVKLIPVDIPPSLVCDGIDPRCSSAYSRLYQSLKDADGRVLPNFLRRYAAGVTPGRVAFMGFSASHGFLNPLLANEADRRDTSAVFLVDASFGGGKTGYQSYVEQAAGGGGLLVATSSNTGGDDSWKAVWEAAEQVMGESSASDPAPGMPQPSGGVWRLGEDAFWYRFVDEKGGTELSHTEQHVLMRPLLEGHLIPWWRGSSGSKVLWEVLLGLGLVAGGAYAARRICLGR